MPFCDFIKTVIYDLGGSYTFGGLCLGFVVVVGAICYICESQVYEGGPLLQVIHGIRGTERITFGFVVLL